MSQSAQTEFNSENLKTVAADILREALKQGASSAEVGIGMNKGFSVSARKGEVESVEYHQDRDIGITVYLGKRSGSANLSDLQPEAIQSAVRAACNIARFTDEDEYSGLAEKEFLAFEYPELELTFPWDISVERAIQMACECEAIGLQYDKRITSSDGVTVTTSTSWQAYGNTQGFLGGYPGTTHEISCLLIAKKGKDMQRDYSYSIAADPALLQSIETIATDAAERTVKRLGSRRLTTRQVPIVFAAEEARRFLGHFVSAIQGGNLYRKSSFLVDQIGQPIFPVFMRIDERPHLPKFLGSAPFDDNGVATRANVFVDEGILKMYSLGVYSARKLNMQTTGNAGGVHNLFVTTSKKTLSELLKTMHTGLLVTELMGQGVNLLTGDYSRGASGFWVENGEIQYPVEEITIAGNLRDMYKQIIEIGGDVDTRGNIQTGSILIENMMIAGN